MMSYDIGPQYTKDRQLDSTGFLEAARKHQSRFRAERLHLPFQNYGNFLTPSDAQEGKNFYSGFGVFDAARKRYPTFSEKVYANMLRSEHIPLNLFHPLNTDDAYRIKVLGTLMNRSIRSVGPFEIEYAPSPASDYLNDRSSFDAYVEYEGSDGRSGLIGIEVKYTEREYRLESGSKQEREVNDRTTPYYKVMSTSGIYRDGSEMEMIKDEYRQIWRNQLLGESIIQKHVDRFDHATLMTVYPSANKHISSACEAYAGFLNSDDQKFVALTYERFIAVCREHVPSQEFKDWLDYLQERYIVDT